MKKIRIPLMVAALVSLTPGAGFSGVLETASDEAYQTYSSCVKNTKDPASCLDDYGQYVRAAGNVIRASGSAEEKDRLLNSITFLDRAAERYLDAASSRGDPSLAERSIRIYSLLEKLQKSRASYFQDQVRKAQSLTGLQDTAIRVRSWLPRFNNDLEGSAEPTAEHSAYLESLSETYGALPADLRLDIDASLARLDAWLERYLIGTRSAPSKVEPSIFGKRIEFYRISQKIPSATERPEQAIATTEGTVAAALNKAAQQSLSVLASSERIWSGAIGSSRVTTPETIVSDQKALAQAYEVALNSIRIIDSSRLSWPYFAEQFAQDEVALKNGSRWDAITEGLSLIADLRTGDLHASLERYLALPVELGKLTPMQTVDPAVQGSISALMKSRVKSESAASLYDASRFLSDVDKYAHNTFLDRELIAQWAAVIRDLINDDSRYEGLDSVVSMYGDLHARHLRDTEVVALKEDILKVARETIEEDSLEEIYAFGGLTLVMTTLKSLPAAVNKVDSGTAADIDRKRYDGLLDSDFDEVDSTLNLYEELVSKITDDAVEDYLDYLDDLGEWGEDSGSSDSAFALSAMAALAGRLTGKLPESEDALSARYPRQQVSVCVLTLLADGSVRLSEVDAMIEGFDDYDPYSVVLYNSLAPTIGVLNLVGTLQTSKGGNSRTEVPEPWISGKEVAEYSFKAFNGVVESCLPEYPGI